MNRKEITKIAKLSAVLAAFTVQDVTAIDLYDGESRIHLTEAAFKEIFRKYSRDWQGRKDKYNEIYVYIGKVKIFALIDRGDK